MPKRFTKKKHLKDYIRRLELVVQQLKEKLKDKNNEQ